jgi:hypothetical protein
MLVYLVGPGIRIRFWTYDFRPPRNPSAYSKQYLENNIGHLRIGLQRQARKASLICTATSAHMCTFGTLFCMLLLLSVMPQIYRCNMGASTICFWIVKKEEKSCMLTQGPCCETWKGITGQENVKLGAAALTTWKQVLIQVGHWEEQECRVDRGCQNEIRSPL